jgi:hypothetical protein
MSKDMAIDHLPTAKTAGTLCNHYYEISSHFLAWAYFQDPYGDMPAFMPVISFPSKHE